MSDENEGDEYVSHRHNDLGIFLGNISWNISWSISTMMFTANNLRPDGDPLKISKQMVDTLRDWAQAIDLEWPSEKRCELHAIADALEAIVTQPQATTEEES